MRSKTPYSSSLDPQTDVLDFSFNPIYCSVCSHQVLNPIYQPRPTFTQAGVHSDDHGLPACFADGKTGAIPPRTQRRLVHGVAPKAAVRPSSTQVIYSWTTSQATHAPDPGRSFCRRMVIDETPPLYCSDQCRLADHQSCHGALDINNNVPRSTSPHPTSPTANSFSDGYGSEDDSGCLSESPSEPLSATSLIIDCAMKAYSRLCDIYGFTPLPPPPPFSPKVATSAQVSAPRLEFGIIVAARRIHAALCTEKPKESLWDLPTHGDSEDDNKPIPGWTDGSNAWCTSVYGFAPPRDFTRTDPDDAAIRAYGSYVATPHRSRGMHPTPNKNSRILEVQTTSSSSLLSGAISVSTKELYRRFEVSFAQRSRSCTSMHTRNVPTIRPTGPTRHSPREVPLLKPSAEGRLLVPDVKMQLVDSGFSSIDSSSGKSKCFVVGGRHCTSSQRNSDAGYTANHTRSYQSESVTYPIMRLTPKKEKHIECRIIDGVERDVEVEVLIEEPIKRLFLFGGARD